MSHYGEFQTEFRDGGLLASALQTMGYQIEVHEEPQALMGYESRWREQKAHIIIRKENTGIGASNDIGFLKQADGTYKAYISEYDEGAKFNQSWMVDLKQSYKEAQQMAVAKLKGYVFLGREERQTEKGKRIQLLFGAR